MNVLIIKYDDRFQLRHDYCGFISAEVYFHRYCNYFLLNKMLFDFLINLVLVLPTVYMNICVCVCVYLYSTCVCVLFDTSITLPAEHFVSLILLIKQIYI